MKCAPATAACVTFAAVLALAGCNSVTYLLPVAPTAEAQYRAYGDSITRGYTLSDPLAQSYPALVAEFEKVTFANNALDTSQACDVPTLQIFANQDSPTLATHPVYSLLIGTNDSRRPDAAAHEPVFDLCRRASVTWFGLPVEEKVLAGGKGATTSGAGALDTENNWNAWTMQGQGASISFTITTTRTAAIYAWPRIADNSPATYSYLLDGVVLGSGSAQTDPPLVTEIGTTDSLGFLRIASVPAGTHVLKFTQTNDGTDGPSIVGIGSPAVLSAGTLPTVLTGTIPYQNAGSESKCTDSDQVCLSYIQHIRDDAALFSKDGLTVRVFDTRKYMHGTAAEMNDSLHPNAFGQKELGESVEAVWQSAP